MGVHAGLQGRSDASIAAERTRFRSDGLITFEGSPIHWWSCKQTVTAWGSCEAETDALALTLKETVKLWALVLEMTEQGVHVKVAMFGDNSANIHLVKRDYFSMSSWRTREFERRAAWIRDQVHRNKVELEHYPGTELVAD